MFRSPLRSRLLLTLGMTVCVSSGLLAQTPTPEDRVTQIASAASLVKPGSKAWHLRMNFQLFDLNGKPAEQGTVEEWWSAPGIYRRVIASPGYNQTIPGNEDQANTSRRTKYLINLLINQVIDPVPHYNDFNGLKVTEENRTFSKVKLACYNVLRAEWDRSMVARRNYPVFCVDPGKDALRVQFDDGNFAVVRNRIGEFRNTQLGLDEALLYNGDVAISGHVETLEAYDPETNPVEMTHPTESVQTIPGILAAGKRLKMTPPIYPEQAKQQRLSGSVILSAIISKEGLISSLEVVASPNPIFSLSAVDAVKHWTYQPYILDGQPTDVDTTITVNYNLNR